MHAGDGWKYAAYMSLLLYVCMVAAGVTVHLLFSLLGIVPETRPTLHEMVRFKLDYTFWLNVLFVGIGGWLLWFRSRNGRRRQPGGRRAAAH